MIDLYISNRGFLFRRAGALMAVMPYESLEITFQPGIPNDCYKQYAESMAGEFIAGETVKVNGENVLLGPARAFTHEVTLRAVGNPDHDQYADIGPRKTVKVVGTDEACRVVRDYQERYNMGAGNLAKEHGDVWELRAGGKRRRVGEVAYNGTYRPLESKRKVAVVSDLKADTHPANVPSFQHEGQTWYMNGFFGYFFQPASSPGKKERVVRSGALYNKLMKSYLQHAKAPLS